MRYRLSAIAGVVIILMAFGACVRRPASGAGRPADLTMFFTSDTRGMLRRCGCSEGQLGGLSARASYLKAERGKGRTLVLDAGDSLFDGMEVNEGAREFYALKSAVIMKAMEQSGYDAAGLGEYDFAYGPGFFKDAVKDTKFPVLAANVQTEDGSKGFEKYIIKRYKGLKVGVVGVLDARFPYESFNRSFAGVSVSDPAIAAADAVKEIGGQADIIIVLAHLSVTDSEVFVKGLKGADLVIQGHSQEILPAPVKVGDALLVKGFNKGKYIGRLDLWLDKGAGRVVDYKYSVITVDESIPPDPEVEGIIAGYRAELKKKAFVIEKPEPGVKGEFIGPEACKGCHAREYRSWSETKHAVAYSKLVRTNDQYDPECLPCHTTGYGYASGFDQVGQDLKNVTCEDCHGRGSVHAGGDPPGASTIKKAVDEGTCRGCHDDYNSPHFEYGRYKARISHGVAINGH